MMTRPGLVSNIHLGSQFIHSLITICTVRYVENVESEALEAVVLGKVVSFKLHLKLSSECIV